MGLDTHIKKSRNDFWTGLLNKNKSSIFARHKPGSDFFMSASLGPGKPRIQYLINKHDSRVEMIIDNDAEDSNEIVYNHFLRKKHAIEQAFGGPLEWKDLPGKKTFRVAKNFDIGGHADRDNWDQIQNTMMAAMLKLHNALKPHIDTLPELVPTLDIDALEHNANWINILAKRRAGHNHAIELEARIYNKCLIPLDRFSELFNDFLEAETDKTGKTAEIERMGSELVQSNFENNKEVRDFVEKVCVWGGSQKNRILNKVRSNSVELIAESFRQASKITSAILRNESLDVKTREKLLVKALKEITKIKGLAVAFGSKHLRFLCPELCPVLDSIISDRTRFKISDPPTDYGKFSTDCYEIAQSLTQRGVRNPISSRDEWYAADVEAAIYWYLLHNE